MRKVAVIMGSDSDYPKLKPCFNLLKQFGIFFEVKVCSAHRTPEEAMSFAKDAVKNGYKVIIAAAGKAAHLPGVIAAGTTIPVIGIPIKSSALEGMDALLSMVQMPPGVPVATVAIDGAENAALLAIQILSLSDKILFDKMLTYREEMAKKVQERDIYIKETMEKEGMYK